jgi:mannose/cellobiose epimerase-like protein (N-acyl-D-glucosamine 2-epimerase family)
MQSRREWLVGLGALATVPVAGQVRATSAGLPGFDVARSQEWRRQLNEVLRDNILAFWLERSIDREHGGYYMYFDAQGKRKAENTKGIVTQARTLWLFSRAARNDFEGEGMPSRNALLAAAKHGWEGMRDIMWDHQHGGFFWLVDPVANNVPNPGKHLYGQSFALYALAEYYRASGEREARGLAENLVDYLERYSYDTRYGGYEEYFEQDWRKPPEGTTGYMGPSHWKLMNTHLHLMEAFSTWVMAHETPLGRRRLEELVQIQSNAVVRKSLGACTDKYLRDWTPVADGVNGRVSYGHDIENVWLLVDANTALGHSSYPLRDLFTSLWEYSLRYGYDAKNGGFYYAGAPNQPASNREKSWWVQSEVLVSALTMYEMTLDTKYLEVFSKTWDLVRTKMVDRATGEWHSRITPGDVADGDKAHNWKAGYHNGRAMIECMRLLKRLEMRKG